MLSVCPYGIIFRPKVSGSRCRSSQSPGGRSDECKAKCITHKKGPPSKERAQLIGGLPLTATLAAAALATTTTLVAFAITITLAAALTAFTATLAATALTATLAAFAPTALATAALAALSTLTLLHPRIVCHVLSFVGGKTKKPLPEACSSWTAPNRSARPSMLRLELRAISRARTCSIVTASSISRRC